MVRVSVEGIKNGLYANTVAQTKTFDMNTEAAMFPDEFSALILFSARLSLMLFQYH
ncbi:MAG: hypothetical protein ABR962_01285 [Candidatus Bathyarchaeia archaeon]